MSVNLFYAHHQRIILKLDITRIESDVAYMGWGSGLDGMLRRII